MKTTNKLGELITSLSKREKKYLQQFIRQQSEGRDHVAYISLYEKLLRNSFITDAELKAKYRNASFNRNIKYNRHYLYETICRSLIALYAEENPNLHQKTQLVLARIFHTRKLYSHASSLLNQIVKEATDLDLGLNLVEAKSLLLGIRARAFHLEDMPNVVDSIYEIEELLKQELRNIELRMLYYKLIEEERQTLPLTEERKEALFKKFSTLLTMKESELTTIRGIMQLQVNTALFYSMVGETEMSVKFLLRNLAEYEKHIPFLKNNIMNYMVVITNALQLSNELKDHDLFKKVFHKTDKLPLNDPVVKAFVVHQVFFNQLSQAVRSGWYDRGITLVKSYGETAATFLETEDQTLLLHCCLLIATAFFCSGYYDECNTWLNRILKRRWKERPDMVGAAHLLNCLSQAESKNYEVLPGLVLTAKRYLKSHHHDDAACTALLNLLLQYDRIGRREQMTQWKKYQVTYLGDEKQLSELLERISIYYWVNNKIKREGS